MPDLWVYYASRAAAGITAIVVLKHLLGGKRIIYAINVFKRLLGGRREKAEWSKNTVVLHQLIRGPRTPSVSPFPIKLETYLRMNSIPYVNDFSIKQSSKNKMPFITYNGEDIADSQFCIEYLNKKFDIDLNKNLSPEQKAVAKAFQRLVEDNMYWIMYVCRLSYPTDKVYNLHLAFIRHATKFPFPSLIMKLTHSYAWKQCYAQGMARHNLEEIQFIDEENLRALSDFLGNKKYLMGDAPSEVDCTMFGMLCQFVYYSPDSTDEKLINEKYTNLRDYSNRMRDQYWPDWDECITHDYTRQATK